MASARGKIPHLLGLRTLRHQSLNVAVRESQRSNKLSRGLANAPLRLRPGQRSTSSGRIGIFKNCKDSIEESKNLQNLSGIIGTQRPGIGSSIGSADKVKDRRPRLGCIQIAGKRRGIVVLGL